MKKLILSALAFVAAASLRAENAAPSYSLTSDFTFVSEYVFRGVKQQSASFQPSVNFEAGAFSAGLWTAQAVEQRTGSWAQGNEIDLFAGYAFALSGDHELALGVTSYLYPSARPSLGEPDSTWELSGGVSGPVGPLTGSATWFHDFELDANAFEFSLAYTVPLPARDVALDISAVYGFNDIADANGGLHGTGGVDYRYHGLDATLVWKLTAAAALKLGVHYADVAKHPGAPGANVWISVGVTTGF